MPDQTPKGLPFPLATDPLADGAAAIQALAEAIDAMLGGGGAELGHAQRTASYFAVPYNAYTDSGLAVTFDAEAGRDYLVEVFWPGAAGLGGNEYRGQVVVDGVPHGVCFSVNAQYGIGPIDARRRLSGLAPGPHTVTFSASTFGGGAGTLYCGDGVGAGNYAPAFLRVLDAGPTAGSTRPGPDEPEAAPKR